MNELTEDQREHVATALRKLADDVESETTFGEYHIERRPAGRPPQAVWDEEVSIDAKLQTSSYTAGLSINDEEQEPDPSPVSITLDDIEVEDVDTDCEVTGKGDELQATISLNGATFSSDATIEWSND